MATKTKRATEKRYPEMKIGPFPIQSSQENGPKRAYGRMTKVWYDCTVETDVKIDVAALDTPHRRALEEVIGRQLAENQRLLISVIEVEMEPAPAARPPQTLDDWTHVYDGLTEQEIEAVDKIVKTRANLTRNLP